MPLGDMFSSGRKFINKFLWIILIPIALDLWQLFAHEYFFKTNYIPIKRLFSLKLGIISSPPSVNFILEDFPPVLLQYNSNGLKGIIYEVSLFNVFFMITIILITSFINSGYLSVLGGKEEGKIFIKDFFIMGNKNWFKFFVLHLIQYIPVILILFAKEFMVLGLLFILFFYVQYSIVIDEGRISENFIKGMSFLSNNLRLTIKMALYFGFIFSLLSILVYVLTSFSTVGIVLDIIIVAYFGAVVNRAILQVYTEKSRG
ncbi:hypothetical protein CLHOM_27860 [Clostridium homopropionicum DSM 5847]|uniref:Uncharacterized protein n=1 Tax=Clostridium homopropionicum DSM 5847 TaxID=1121318 RepID=A0A0L6Z7A4_9CLOT|nr:hypothetical protein [Clostridium homopropionicum]KOA18847.1 hypothetical protein CLHOM_27860 [Clostridium homopropionicum DSM 5847]SFG90209.1 hypothetical protein SAMN04488501_12234 [Clostridium homopropionicum]